MVISQAKKKLINTLTIGVGSWMIVLTTYNLMSQYYPDTYAWKYVVAVGLILIGVTYNQNG